MSSADRGAEEVYLDWNAAAPLHPDVERAMSEARREAWANPASVHAAGRRARALVEDARETVAARLGVEARDVVFTSGGTEANNLALHRAPALVTSRIEHPSVVRVAEQLESRGVPVVWLPVSESGRIEPERGGAGARLAPARRLRRADGRQSRDRRAPAARRGRVPDGERRGAPACGRGAGGGAPSAGDLRSGRLLRGRVAQDPRSEGDRCARLPAREGPAPARGGRRSRTRAASRHRRRGGRCRFSGGPREAARSERRYRELEGLRDELERALGASAERNGSAPRAFHVTNLSVRGLRGDELVAMLDLEGVRISSGSACSAGTTEPSAVITAMLGRERAERAVRLSLGEETSRAQIEYAIVAGIAWFRRPPRRTSSDG